MRGEVIDVFPAECEIEALRIELFDGEIENLAAVRPADRRGLPQAAALHDLSRRSHYVTTRRTVLEAIETIKVELSERLEQLYARRTSWWRRSA